MVRIIALVILSISPLVILQARTFGESIAEGMGNIAEGMDQRAQLEKERAILYGRLRAEGLTKEFLNDASFNDLIELVAYTDQLRAMGLKALDIQTKLADIEKTHFEKKQEIVTFKRLKIKDRRRLAKGDKRLSKEDEWLAFKRVLNADQGHKVKVYIDLGGADMRHIEVLMKLDQIDKP